MIEIFLERFGSCKISRCNYIIGNGMSVFREFTIVLDIDGEIDGWLMDINKGRGLTMSGHLRQLSNR